MKHRKFIKTIFEYLNESNYDDREVFDIPVDIVWCYREFDRCGDDKIWSSKYVESLTNDIKENGIKNPIILSYYDKYGIVTEGNHRLCIAKKLGIKNIKVILKQEKHFNTKKAKPISINKEQLRNKIFDGFVNDLVLNGDLYQKIKNIIFEISPNDVGNIRFYKNQIVGFDIMLESKEYDLCLLNFYFDINTQECEMFFTNLNGEFKKREILTTIESFEYFMKNI